MRLAMQIFRIAMAIIVQAVAGKLGRRSITATPVAQCMTRTRIIVLPAAGKWPGQITASKARSATTQEIMSIVRLAVLRWTIKKNQPKKEGPKGPSFNI